MEQLNLGDLNFEVHTTSHRGHTPEEIAEFALDKIMYVSKDANPLIKEQAEAFKGHIRQVLIHHLKWIWMELSMQENRLSIAIRFYSFCFSILPKHLYQKQERSVLQRKFH